MSLIYHDYRAICLMKINISDFKINYREINCVKFSSSSGNKKSANQKKIFFEMAFQALQSQRGVIILTLICMKSQIIDYLFDLHL